MRNVRATPIVHYSKKRAFVHKTLHSYTYIFVKINAVRKPLEQSYEGPYKVLDLQTMSKVNLQASQVKT